MELAERLAASGSASRQLHFLARNQVFTFDAGRRGTYRYHNLLRDYLRQRFVQDEGERAFRALQLETASALEACGDRPGAIELLLGANELELALDVIARGGEPELERRPSEQLRIWVSRLAPTVEAERPWALVRRRRARHTREPLHRSALGAAVGRRSACRAGRSRGPVSGAVDHRVGGVLVWGLRGAAWQPATVLSTSRRRTPSASTRCSASCRRPWTCAAGTSSHRHRPEPMNFSRTSETRRGGSRPGPACPCSVLPRRRARRPES